MPNVVKGSKQEKMVVVPYRPVQRRLVYVIPILVLIFGGAGGFMFGQQAAQGGGFSEQTERELVRREMTSLREENAELRRRVALMDRSSIMDKKANEEVQQTVLALQDRIAQLEQDILFYRQVMSEEADNIGLTIGQMDVEATDQQNRYRYKLVLRQQEADGDSFLEGHVNVNLVGQQNGAQVVIPLRDVSENESQLDIRLRFKYFQNIEGEMILPADFVPEQIHITALSTAPTDKTINKNFSWVVGGK